MPNINEFLKKGSPKTDSKKNDWDLSSMISNSKASIRPQRRPGRGEDAPHIPTVSTASFGDTILPSLTDQELVTDKKADTNKTQGGNKAERNQGESRDKVEREPERNQRESRDKVERDLTGGKIQSREKVARKVESEVEREYGESAEKVERKFSFSELIGLERKVTLFIFDQCQLMGSRVTAPISINHLCTYCQTVVSSAKRTILTLQKKTIILRVKYKDGRGGWTKYSLTDSIFSEILQTETSEKLRRNQRESREKVESQLESQLERAFPSSSSSYVLEDFKTTTTGETKTVGNTTRQLGQEWLEIDYSVLSEIHFGPSQLSQIAQLGKLKSNEVQDSINAFAFDLKKNQKEKDLKSSALNFFMGILRKGMPYTPPENYESPEDAAFRKCLESKRTQLARRQAMEQEMIDLEFQEWSDGLTAVERRDLAPHAKIGGSEMQTAALRQYFENHVYSKRTQEPLTHEESPEEIRRQIDQSLGLISGLT